MARNMITVAEEERYINDKRKEENVFLIYIKKPSISSSPGS